MTKRSIVSTANQKEVPLSEVQGMSSDAYDEFFDMHHERVKGDSCQLIKFSVRFFRLVCYPEETLEELAKCPGG